MPFDVPKGWVWTTLDAIAKFSGGKTPSMDNKSNWDNGKHLWITSKDMKSEAICNSQIMLSDSGLQGMTIHQPGTILMVNRSGILRRTLPIGILQKEATINQDLKAITPFLFELTPFLLFCLKAFEPIILQDYKKAGTTVDNINFDHFVTIPIPLPPIQEQGRIVQSVQNWNNRIEDIEKASDQIQNAIEATKSKILELAIHGKLVAQDPSEESAIEFLKRTSPAFRPSHNLHYGERLPAGWTCGLFGDLNQHRNKSEDPLASPEDEYELYSVPIYDTGMPEFLNGNEIGSTKQVVDKGDVLLCKINPHLNRSWVVSHYRPELKCIASSEWLVFSSAAILPDYARLFFMSPGFKSLMQSNVSGVGGSLMRARASAVNSYPIWVPPINEQYRIVQAVHQFYATIELMASNL